MPFRPNDFYTLSGDANLYNCWTDKVTKFDSSSFYNWEQDNEPLYDLEERTYVNWEHAGFHGSSVPGLVFTVSADAQAAGFIDCGKNIFTDVSSAIEALPSELRFPVLIEVANYGNMGELHLKNIKMGYNGSLEIINRNFAKAYGVSGGAASGATTGGLGNLIQEYAAVGHSKQELVGEGLITAISGADVSATWKDSKAVFINTPVLSGTHPKADPRLDSNIRSVLQPLANKERSSGRGPGRLSVCINGSPSGTGTAGSPQYRFWLPPFESLAAAITTPHVYREYDVSAYSNVNGNPLRINPQGDNTSKGENDLATGMLYGNSLNLIDIQNCDGPIYIRNFFVDSNYGKETGINVQNSNVWLENCASIRNREAGFKFSNSKIILARGIAAYRNYGTDSDNKRLTGQWLGNDNSSQKDSTFVDLAAGMKAINSEVTFSSTTTFEDNCYPGDYLINFSRNANGVTLENSILRGGVTQTTPGYYLSGTQFNVELNNDHGIVARNSTINLDGKLAVTNNTRGVLLENTTAILDTFRFHGNQREALHSIGSHIKYNKGLLKVDRGNAPLPTDYDEYQFDFSGNGRHLVLESGSTFNPFIASAMAGKYGQMRFTAPHGINSSSSPAPNFSAIRVVPPVVVEGGSKAVFVHPIMFSHQLAIDSEQPTYGGCIAVTNNSKAVFKGTINGATAMFGPTLVVDHEESYYLQRKMAGVYAGENSTVEFNGPTVLAQFGVDVLAEDGSTMKFNPHRKANGILDIDSWDLWNPANHTAVELHSTKSCLVANRNSTINMQDLGDFNGYWPQSQRENPDYDTGPDGLETSGYTKHGGMQFYPNPNTVIYGGDGGKSFAFDTGTITILNSDETGPNGDYTFKQYAGSPTYKDVEGQNHKAYYYLTDSHYKGGDHRYHLSAITAGGMCVRAVGGSNVNVLNVNFPCGWWNPSGIIYDCSASQYTTGMGGGVCSRLFIWNMADTSRLNASFCSVSGRDPRNQPETAVMGVPYHGPSAVWTHRAVGGTGAATAYRLPKTTPDTSTLSVLDFYGAAGTNVHGAWPLGGELAASGTAINAINSTWGQRLTRPVANVTYGSVDGIPRNLGPFRLYVSVDPVANFLSSVPIDSGEAHKSAIDDAAYAPQLFAQGYNLSGSVSAASDLSATWGSIIRVDVTEQVSGTELEAGIIYGSTALTTSGYIYHNEMVDPTTYTRIILDESAANIFANAKNGAMGTSNRAKICTIYKSKTDMRGEAAVAASKGNTGVGFKSSNIFDLNRDE